MLLGLGAVRNFVRNLRCGPELHCGRRILFVWCWHPLPFAFAVVLSSGANGREGGESCTPIARKTRMRE